MRNQSHTRHGGFTLIELMITVVVIGILAAIAYPSYTEYVKRGHRSAAQTYMLDLAQREQQYFLDTRSYTNSVTDLVATPASVSNHYTVTITLNDGLPPGYTITAVPTGSQISDGNLTIDNTGQKTPASKW